MSDKNIVEFVRFPDEAQERSSKAVVEQETLANVGGGEGAKHLLHLVKPERKRSLGQFFAKDERAYAGNYVKYIIKAYETAKREGFPVPPTIRYFERYGNASILMTDMSDNNRYLVWGYNDNSKESEHNTLIAMDFNDSERDQIRQQTRLITENAIKHKRPIYFFNYHIRKNPNTKKVEVFLVDLSGMFNKRYESSKAAADTIEKQAEIFLELAFSPPEEHNKILNDHKEDI